MQAPHHRKIELQSPADLSYLYSNTIALSREKLELHFPPSKRSQDGSNDPTERRVKELVEDFILRTFQSATPSISINGLDVTTIEGSEDGTSTANANANANQIDPNVTTFSFKTQSAVEYEPYDSNLAAKVTALYAKLENLTTDVAKLRREAPRKAAKVYAEELQKALKRDDERAEEERRRGDGRELDDDEDDYDDKMVEDSSGKAEYDAGAAAEPLQEISRIHTLNDSNPDNPTTTTTTATTTATATMTTQPPNNCSLTRTHPDPNRRRSARLRQKQQGKQQRAQGQDGMNIRPEWRLTVPYATQAQQDRWRSGDVTDVYSRAVQTLVQLQGDGVDDTADGKVVSRALATTVGKLERSRKAVDVIEAIAKKGRTM